MEGIEDTKLSETIIIKKRTVIQVSDQESVAFLKSYQLFQWSWERIVDHMKQQNLLEEASSLYQRATYNMYNQVKLGLSTKLGKLLKMPLEKISSLAVKNELIKVKNKERKYVTTTEDVTPQVKQPQCQPNVPAQTPPEDIREKAMTELSSGDEKPVAKKRTVVEMGPSELSDDQIPGPSNPKKKKSAEPSLMQLVKKNQLSYEKFMARKIPKILKAVGVSSSSESDD